MKHSLHKTLDKKAISHKLVGKTPKVIAVALFIGGLGFLLSLFMSPHKALAVNLSTLPLDKLASMSAYDQSQCKDSYGNIIYEWTSYWLYSNGNPVDDGAAGTTGATVSPGGTLHFNATAYTFLCHFSIAPFNTNNQDAQDFVFNNGYASDPKEGAPFTAFTTSDPHNFLQDPVSLCQAGDNNFCYGNGVYTGGQGHYLTRQQKILYAGTAGVSENGANEGTAILQSGGTQLIDFQTACPNGLLQPPCNGSNYSTRYWAPESESNTSYSWQVPNNLSPGTHSLTVNLQLWAGNLFFANVGNPPDPWAGPNSYVCLSSGNTPTGGYMPGSYYDNSLFAFPLTYNGQTFTACPSVTIPLTVKVNVPYPPAAFSCKSSSVTQPLDAGAPGTFNYAVNYVDPNPVAPNDVRGTVTIAVKNSSGQTVATLTGNIGPGGPGTLTGSTTGTFNAAGNYTYTWSFNPANAPPGSTNNAINCPGAVSNVCGATPCTFQVVYEPYMQVKGGDVVAGSTFADKNGNCSPTKAAIVGWNIGGPFYVGAGTQFAAYALGHIDDFVSGQYTSNAGHNLSFANTSNTSPPGYGGQLGSLPCATNYYAKADPANSSFKSDPPPAINNLPAGTYNYYAPGNLLLAGTVPLKAHATIYVNGDVYIGGSGINYANSGSWGSLDDIPKLTIVACGDINITGSVAELDGTYIAEPKADCGSGGGGGNISTCFDGATSVNWYNTCNHQLAVYGSFIANKIYYQRSYGNLLNAGNPVGSVPGQPAEVFYFSPESWLSDTGTGWTTGGSGSTLSAPCSPTTVCYESITSLPPIL